MPNFRLNGKYLFLTYSQCSLEPKDLIEVFKAKLKWFKWCVVSNELHKDGSPHRHVFIALDKVCDLTGPSCLDCMGVHGSYEVAKKPQEAYDYVIKDGDVFYEGITAEEAEKAIRGAGKRVKVWEDINDRLIGGQTVKQICLEAKVLQYLDKIERARAMLDIWNMPPKEGFERALVEFGEFHCDANVRIAQWLNTNIGKPRAFKQQQLYVYGGTGIGKTSLINRLKEVLNVYSAPYDAHWMDGYDDSYDLVVFDEFRAQYTIQFLNQFLEGECPCPRRGVAPYQKRKNVPCLFLSNYSPVEAYSKVGADRLETLQARLLVVNAVSPIRVSVNPTHLSTVHEQDATPSALHCDEEMTLNDFVMPFDY